MAHFSHSFIFFLSACSTKFQTLQKRLNIEIKQFSVFGLVSEIETCLLVFDDSFEEIFNDKEFSKLATGG